MKKKFLIINIADNVGVAIDTLPEGDELTIGTDTLVLVNTIPAGHKFSLKPMSDGDIIVKYGYPIGHCISEIPQGALVNEQNIKTNLDGILEYSYNPTQISNIDPQPSTLTFMGYKRENGEVGIRNEIVVLPTVGCVNGTVNKLAESLRAETRCAGVDAITAYPHNYGCSQLGDDHENTRKILRDIVQHPNIGGVLIVGLGCENNQVSKFKQLIGEFDSSRIKFIETQKASDELEEGMILLREIYQVVSRDKREEVPFSSLRVGLKCGGSDGFSGITANPLLGRLSDILIAQGGTSILTEVPEMFGAETILMNRSKSVGIFNKTVHLINDFKDYFIQNKQPIYENPSPGNKAGGISTLEEKSLGCTQKCGQSLISDVLLYGDRIKVSGLNLLSAPGNDLVASTALAAAGCQIVLFTTGRGTPFGTFVPTMKVSTNTALSLVKPNWIDFNAGTIVESESIESVCEKLIQYLIEVASGTFVNNEKSAFKEISIFKTGVTL